MSLKLITKEKAFYVEGVTLKAEFDLDEISFDEPLIFARVYDGETEVACIPMDYDEDDGGWLTDIGNDGNEYCLDQYDDEEVMRIGIHEALNGLDLTEDPDDKEKLGFSMEEASVSGIYLNGLGLNKWVNEETGEIRLYSYDAGSQKESSKFVSFFNDSAYETWIEDRGEGHRYADANLTKILLNAFEEEADSE